MSKASPYAPSPIPMGSRSSSPPPGTPIDSDKQGLMNPSLMKSGRAEEPSTRDQVLPIMAYCAASIMMTVVNKYVVSGRHFTMTFLLLSIQSAVCVLVVSSVKRMGVINFRDFDMKDARAWFPVSSLLVAVIYTGSKAIQYLPIPVFTIFKNLTIILTAYGEVFMFGNSVTGLTLVSFALIVGSSVIAAWADVNNGATSGKGVTPSAGYIWMALNCFASAAYVLYMRKRIKVTGFKDWDSMFYNNLLSIPVLAVASIVLEDWGTRSLIANFPPENRLVLLSAIAFSGAAAVLISYSTAWCVRVCGSTTYSMVGALNKLPVAASGMLFFGDPASFGNVSAIGVGGLAGIVYSVAKINQGKVEKAKAAQGGRA